MTSSPRSHPMLLAPIAPTHQRQLSMVFESPMLQGMSHQERASAVTQLAILLLEAAGVHAAGVDDDEH
jgi:hypothetical protein